MLAKRGREAGSSMLWKEFPGGVLSIVGANSPAGFRSTPACRLMQDEIDGYPLDAGDEGDPVKLARRALTTFESSAQEFDLSTPTIEGRSRIDQLFKETDQRYYFVPCPFCGHEQRLVWSGMKWEKDSEGKDLPETARYQCAKCEKLIEEHHKTAMLAAGAWHPTVAGTAADVRGY